MIQRQVMLEVGLFDERCRTAYDDVELRNRLRTRGHTLLYDPASVATHLKRSTPGDVVRGFWSYWAAKNGMEGAYESLASAGRLMVRRQMGIAAFRISQDVRHRRNDLLPLDLLIPLTFCVRDLESMVRLKTLSRSDQRMIGRCLADACLDQWERHFPTPPPGHWLSLAAGDLGRRDLCLTRCVKHAGRCKRRKTGMALHREAEQYVLMFSRHFGRLLTGLTERVRRSVVEYMPMATSSGGRVPQRCLAKH